MHKLNLDEEFMFLRELSINCGDKQNGTNQRIQSGLMAKMGQIIICKWLQKN